MSAEQAARALAHEVLGFITTTPDPCAAHYPEQAVCDRLVALLVAHQRECERLQGERDEALRRYDLASRSELGARTREDALRVELASLKNEVEQLRGPAEVCRVHGEVCVHGRRAGGPCLHCGGRASK